MLSRELLPEIGWSKPICISTPLITSLKGPETKMSVSIPGSFITVHESIEELEKSLVQAYCPPKITDKNPMLDIVNYIIFPFFKSFKIERDLRYGEIFIMNILMI